MCNQHRGQEFDHDGEAGSAQSRLRHAVRRLSYVGLARQDELPPVTRGATRKPTRRSTTPLSSDCEATRGPLNTSASARRVQVQAGQPSLPRALRGRETSALPNDLPRHSPSPVDLAFQKGSSRDWPALTHVPAVALLQHQPANPVSSLQTRLFSIDEARRLSMLIRRWGRPSRDLADLRRGDRGSRMPEGNGRRTVIRS